MKLRNARRFRSLTKRTAAIGALLVLALTGATSAWAHDEYTAGRKAGRGFAAVTTGFLEVPGNIVAETERNGAASGMTIGFAKGLGGLVVRHLVGAYEIVTAPFAVPAGYRPILRPEYPWGYFDESREYAHSHRHDGHGHHHGAVATTTH
jgi:putative exosortase-associated protein (TIGR04073 family)